MKIKEFFFTAFYSGYSPIAPGTAGTLVATALYILENLIFSETDSSSLNLFNLVFIILIIYPSIKLGDAAEKFYKSKDPQHVVLDEMLGYWIGVLFIPFSFTYAVIAFILFRIFDIIKPFPARSLESLTGGLGIMMDDIIAGLYTLAVMHAAVYLFNMYNIVLP
ncbi:MAG TPA: phosphatidylglycerophosphatase A [Spirochaetota bacterium]|nr:phosphatidylglycerophosphatase A [Spirochaetota bacterium]HPS85746.1 phosphatidylglycerophosphatase A [Spirochaetota bacterium]